MLPIGVVRALAGVVAHVETDVAVEAIVLRYNKRETRCTSGLR